MQSNKDLIEKNWSPESWKAFPATQIPIYPNEAHLFKTIQTLKNYPPLVFAGEARSLKARLAKAVDGNAFLLQGGDCAESFAEFNPQNIRDTFRIILQMAVILSFASGMPIIKVGRMAGQFAKPRSDDKETRDGQSLPSYRGDIINGYEFNEAERTPNPDRIIQAYNQSAATLNLIRAFANGGYADLHRVHQWTLDFVKDSNAVSKYEDLAMRIDQALKFIAAAGITPENSPHIREAEFYTSHEALLLPYEEALTRIDSTSGDYYGVSGHFLWIGDRTRDPHGAHVEYIRGIQNPIGIKCGPSMTSEDVITLLDRLNPKHEKGRITLIVRMGKDKIADHLPKLIKTVVQTGHPVVWCSDPMHGNTQKTLSGYKTRHFDDILSEIRDFFAIHRAEGTYAGGVHFELTGQNVTECTGGLPQISEYDLKNNYVTQCDPRLNAQQALDIAFMIADELKKGA